VWARAKKERSRRSLAPLAEMLLVLSDVEMAHRAAFGDGPGILIVAGTGSIAFGRDASGRRARAGGLGPGKGDEGSGFWIGREYLRARRDARLPRLSVREIASFARTVLLRARRRDPLARRIVAQAQSHLA